MFHNSFFCYELFQEDKVFCLSFWLECMMTVKFDELYIIILQYNFLFFFSYVNEWEIIKTALLSHGENI